MVKRNSIYFFFLALVLIGVAILVFLLNKDQNTKNSTENNRANRALAKSTPDLKPTPAVTPVSSYEVPILMYHYIRELPGDGGIGDNLSVSPRTFDSHLKALKSNNYETVKLNDLSDPNRTALTKVISSGRKPIVITFDDGYADAYTNALPTLKKYDFTGTFFIIRNFVGRAEYMNQDQIDKLAQAGMEIGSHTLSHPDLSKTNANDALEQLTESKQSAQTFCYPAGRYSEETLDLVKKAGYTAAVTTKPGIASEKSNLLELPRVRVENISAENLIGKIQ